jgi:hypothetical protein
MATISFVPAASSGVEVSDEVVQEVEETYAFLTANPNQKAQAKFGSVNEKNSWLRQVRAYAAGREGGALKFRLLPDKANALPDTEIYFRLTADLPANGARNDIKHA